MVTLKAKAILKVKKTVDLKIMVLLSFLKSGRQNHKNVAHHFLTALLVLLRGKRRPKLSSNSHVHSHQKKGGRERACCCFNS
jgi:hypothetical protein